MSVLSRISRRGCAAVPCVRRGYSERGAHGAIAFEAGAVRCGACLRSESKNWLPPCLRFPAWESEHHRCCRLAWAFFSISSHPWLPRCSAEKPPSNRRFFPLPLSPCCHVDAVQRLFPLGPYAESPRLQIARLMLPA